MTAILIFKCTEGAGAGDYSFRGRWALTQDAARNAKRSISTILRKNRGLWTVYAITRLETLSTQAKVVGERENGRTRGRHARGPSPLASTSFPGFSPTRPTDRREVMHQLIPAAPGAPRADPRALAFFFWPWMANSRRWGLLSCQIPRGGDEKRGQMPRPPSTLQHFSLITQSNSAILGI